MTDNIVERLRSKSPYLHGSSAERAMTEAAAEIERLTERGMEAEAWCNQLQAVIDARDKRCDRQEAEIERLRTALRRIVAGDHIGSHNGAIAVARAALEPKP